MMWRPYPMDSIVEAKISASRSKSPSLTYWWEVPPQISHASCPTLLGTRDLQVGLLWFSRMRGRWEIFSLKIPDACLPIWLATSKLLTISSASSLMTTSTSKLLTIGAPWDNDLLQSIRNLPIIILDDLRTYSSYQWFLALTVAIHSVLPLPTLTEQRTGFTKRKTSCRISLEQVQLAPIRERLMRYTTTLLPATVGREYLKHQLLTLPGDLSQYTPLGALFK